MSAWSIVLLKELRETLRDRRTLLMMIAVPVLLYPVIFVVSEQLFLFGQRSLEEQASPVAIVGGEPGDLLELVRSDSALRLVPVTGDPEKAIRSDSVAAVALLGPEREADASRPVTIVFDAASDRSRQGRQKLRGVLAAWRDTLLQRRLSAHGLTPGFARPIAVSDSSVARPEEVGGYTLGRILPLLLVVVTLLGAFYPAIDLAAGEKERGTLETLLTAPVPARSVVTGKFVAVALIGVVAAALNLASMVLTFQTGLVQMADVPNLKVSLSAGALVVIFLTLIPLAVLFSALFLGIAVRSASFKEAQNALTPIYMLVIVPAMLPLFPGIDFGPLLALVPVAGVSFLFRDLMAGDAVAWKAFLVVGSTVLYAVAALAFAAHVFGSERVLFASGETGGEREGAGSLWSRLGLRRVSAAARSVPSPQASLGFVAGVAVLFFYAGVGLQAHLGERGLLLSEWLLLLAPALVFSRAGGFDLRRTLSLRAPRRAALAGALLLIAGCMPIAWAIGWLQSFVLPVPWQLLRGLEQLVTAHSLRRLAWLVLLLAITPAICEEMVFRGVLLGGTRSLTPWRAILLNGLVFGAFHLSFETAIRFLPTAWLGIVIAWAVWRTGSIWIGVLMHFLNNGTILVLASVPALRAWFSDPRAAPPFWLIGGAALALVAGVRVLNRRNVESETT